MYELKIKGHVTRNWGHVPICFKIGNVSPEFLANVFDFGIIRSIGIFYE